MSVAWEKGSSRVGEKQRKSGFTPGRGSLYAATMGLHDGSDNGQAESGTFALSCPGWIDTVKAVENVRQVFGWYLWARVLNAEGNLLIRGPGQLYQYFFTRGRMAYGIGQQVVQRGLQFVTIRSPGLHTSALSQL